MNDMTSAEYFDNKWKPIIKAMPNGGAYRYDLRKYGYNIIVDYIKRESRVFDYACGLPVVSKMLIDNKDCIVAGCDFSSIAIIYAKTELPKYEWKKSSEIFGTYYDYIIASYLLEHLEYPVEFVDYALRFTNELICSLPNNFKHTGEHINMQWDSWDSFNKLFKDFHHFRIDIGEYPPDLKKDFQHPIVVFKRKVNHS